MGFIEQIAPSAAGAIMGLALQGHNDRRQREQQNDLQNIQIRGNKQMMDYSMMKQMEMWKNTNFAAQIAEMKKAGISPGLIYGMKGGGGITTGSPGGQVTGATAPTGGGEIQSMIGMGMQLQLLKAQKENIEADTAQKQATTTKTAGVDTQKATTEIMSLTQGIENQKAEQALKEVQTRIASLDEWIKGKSAADAVDIIMWQSEKILAEVEQLSRENIVNKATMNDRIDMVKTELAVKALMPALIRAQTTTEQGKPAIQAAEIDQIYTQTKDIVRKAVQRWRDIEMKGEEVGMDQRAQLREEMKTLGIPNDLLDEVLQAIILKNVISPKAPTRRDPNFWKHRKTDVIK